MLSDGIYRISAGKHARFQASLTYYDCPVGFAELRPDGKWYVYINDIDPLSYPDYVGTKHIGAFRALGSALSALWEQRFNTIAEMESSKKKVI